MSWILLSLISAALLGLYDIAKKVSVRDNAVPVVLLVSVTTAACVWTPGILLAYQFPDLFGGALRSVADLDRRQHLLIFGKSLLVGASWTCAFFSLKHLPISIASTIRGTSPLWTVSIAVVMLGERPDLLQWIGMILILGAFYAFSQVGNREVVEFHRNVWVYIMVVATVLGGCSALYDKFLLQYERLSPLAVQAWFSVYLVPVMLPLAVHWAIFERIRKPFTWRITIPLIAILLLATDLAYFTAVYHPDALIAVISPLRRTSLIVAFAYGVFVLKEESAGSKAVCIAVLLLGVVLLSR